MVWFIHRVLFGYLFNPLVTVILLFFFFFFCNFIYRFTKYSKLEGTHKDHIVQSLSEWPYGDQSCNLYYWHHVLTELFLGLIISDPYKVTIFEKPKLSLTS